MIEVRTLIKSKFHDKKFHRFLIFEYEDQDKFQLLHNCEFRGDVYDMYTLELSEISDT